MTSKGVVRSLRAKMKKQDELDLHYTFKERKKIFPFT